jgi:hypothetical protein
MNIDVIEVTAPECWASYLINGDASGLDDNEQKACDSWLASLAPYTDCLDCLDCVPAGFMWWHDARGYALAADCETYTFARVEE